MELSQLLGMAAGTTSLLPYIFYLRDMFSGKTQPERASWFIWAVLGGIAFFSQLAKGATDSLWLTGVQTLGVIVVSVFSLKYGVGGFMRRDIIALVFAALGLLVWYFTSEAATALFIVIAIDAVGMLLTIIKAYEQPESETFVSWILFCISGFLAIFSIGSFDWVLLSYPIYIALANLSVVIAILMGRRRVGV